MYQKKVWMDFFLPEPRERLSNLDSKSRYNNNNKKKKNETDKFDYTKCTLKIMNQSKDK